MCTCLNSLISLSSTLYLSTLLDIYYYIQLS
nr:MAG TPA: hypothetical protein [Caudoviricetes sp.]